MKYRTYTDDELCRELATLPCNTAAMAEAARRFVDPEHRDEIARQCYDEGYRDGQEAADNHCWECGCSL